MYREGSVQEHRWQRWLSMSRPKEVWGEAASFEIVNLRRVLELSLGPGTYAVDHHHGSPRSLSNIFESAHEDTFRNWTKLVSKLLMTRKTAQNWAPSLIGNWNISTKTQAEAAEPICTTCTVSGGEKSFICFSEHLFLVAQHLVFGIISFFPSVSSS